jgi:enterochelin esterase family protein
MGQSMAELPGAALQPWIVQNATTPEGHVENQRFKSARLNNERSMSIYTPAGYTESGPPCNLLVVFDERAYLKQVPTPVILDNLIAAAKIPSTVAILIGNITSDLRNAELAPNPLFADFLAGELVPWVRAHYNVSRDPRRTVVAGSSLGGIAATYAAFRHPEIFGNVLSQSGSFWWSPDHGPGTNWDATTETGWLAKQFLNSPKLAVAFYLDAGVFEADSAATGGAILEPSRQMRDVLLAKGYTVHYQQFIGGHDYLSWRGTFADGLMALIGTKDGGLD